MRRLAHAVFFITVLALLTVPFAGCSASSQSGSPVQSGTSNPAATENAAKLQASPSSKASSVSKEPLKIGAVLSITGPNAPLGRAESNALKLLEEELNAKGGINGRLVNVITYDDESDETKAVMVVKKLISDDNALAIIGSTGSGQTLAMMPVVEGASVPLVSLASAAKIVDPVQKWIFKTAQRDSSAVSKIDDYLKQKGLTKAAIIFDSNAYGVSGKEQLEALAPADGITIVSKETYNSKDTDMTAQLTRIKGSNAQALIVWGSNPGPAIITKNARELNMTMPILHSAGSANDAFIKTAGKAANGVLIPTSKMLVADDLPASDPQKPVLIHFREAYKAKYGEVPGTFAGNAYDAFQLIVHAIEKKGATRAQIRDGIESTENLVGINGIFNMSAKDHNGLSKDGFVMIEVADGKWTLAK